MRVIRLVFIVVIALILIAIALANREPVLISLFPASLDSYFGGDLTIRLPLFLVIFLAAMFGMVAGLVLEWMRETQYRRAAKNRSKKVDRLEREVGQLRDTHRAPRDDVLAIVDQPRTKPAPAPAPVTLPATR